MLTVENLTIHYDVKQALKDVSFSCESGEILSLIGPSGCGKTSLLNVLAGNVKTYEGSLGLNGGRIDHKSMNIGLIAQDYGLLPWKTVYSNIILPLKIKRLKPALYKARIDYVMEHLQIEDLKKSYPNQLSGGQKQRVAIAKAFIMDLDLLLMDEPFSALDAITREQTQQLFVDIWSRKKTITLFVTHSIEEAAFLGKKIVLFSPAPGRIIKIMDNPAFGTERSRNSPQFHNLCMAIRETIKREWSYAGG